MNNLSTALNANSTISAIYTANAASGVISITEKIVGGGNTPGDMTVVGTGTITVGTATNSKTNDTITINGIVFTAVNSGASGNQFNIGADTTETATNLKNVLNSNSTINALYTATSSNNIITLTEKIVGGGNTPTIATVTGTVVIINGTIITSASQIYPSAPDTPTGGLLLVKIAVGAGVTSIIQSNITDERNFKVNNNTLTSQMAEKASEITFSVKKFGAKGDGVTDDTIALQAAFDYATQNNVNIFIDEGVYIVTSSLVININMGSQWELGHSKFSILGASNKTIFSSKISSGDVLKIKANINGTFATGVLIGNFKIVNFDTSTIYLSNALVIEDTQHIEYKNIEIYKFKNGLILTNSDLNTWTEFNKFNNIIINSCVNNLVFDGKNSSFRNNRFENVYLVAVDNQGTPEEQTAIKMLSGIIYNNYWDIAISISGKATMFFIGSMSQMNFGNITYEINKSLVDNLYHLPRIKAYPKTGEGTLDSDSYIFNFTGVICGMNDQSAPKFEYVDGCEFTPTGNNRLNSSAVRPGVKLTSQQIVGWGTNNYELEYLDRRTRDGWDGGTTKFNILRYISDSNDDEGYVISSFQRSSANLKPNKVSIGLVPVDGDMTGYVRGFNLYMDGSIIEAGNGQKLVFDTNGIKRGTYKIYDVGTITKFWGSPGIEISPNGKVEYWGEITASTIADGQEFIVNSFNGNFDNIRNIQLTLVGNTLGSQAVVKSFTSTSMVVKANIKASCTIHYRIIGDKTIG